MFDKVDFFLHGPHGRGLGLVGKETGTHIVFAGGTGVLVFVDLVCYLMRKTVAGMENGFKAIDDEDFSDLADGFRLVLHLSVSKRDEAIGIELYEGFQQLCDKLSLDTFKLMANFTREGGARLTAETARSIMEQEKPEKVWVCGAPLYNEIFEKDLANVKQPKIEIF